MSTATTTFASLLVQSEVDPQAGAELRRQRRLFLIPLAVAAAMLALWMIAAPLSGAIIAAGKLKVELNRKTVQHQEGGIVRSILVRDGDMVRAGQPLIVVGDVRNDAELNMLRDQLRAERIRNARASAEAVLAAKFQAPADLAGAAGAGDDLARETALFQARRRTLDEQIASLEAQTRDSRAQAAALTKQIETTAASAKLAADELEINEKLVRQGYV